MEHTPSLAVTPFAAGWTALQEDPGLELVASCRLLDHGSQKQLGPLEGPIYWLPLGLAWGFDCLPSAKAVPERPYPRG